MDTLKLANQITKALFPELYQKSGATTHEVAQVMGARGLIEETLRLQLQQQPIVPRDMSAAPKDGTTLRLLVNFTEHSLEDNEHPQWTIGHNNFDHDGEDVWQFAGWCWQHDHYTEGQGLTPIGWLPLVMQGDC